MVTAICFVKDCAWEQDGLDYMDAALDAIKTHYRREHPRKVFRPDDARLEFYNKTPDELAEDYQRDPYYINDIVRSYGWRMNAECKAWWDALQAERARGEAPRRGRVARFQDLAQAAFVPPPDVNGAQGAPAPVEWVPDEFLDNIADEAVDRLEDGGF